MSEPKTKPTGASVKAFLDARVTDPVIRADCDVLIGLMEKATGAPATMWGPSIVGFGSYRYVYTSKRTGDWMLTGFAPRGKQLVVYVMPGFEGYNALMAKLGTYTNGVSCIYFKRLSDLHRPTLKTLIVKSVKHLRATFPGAATAKAVSAAPAARGSAKKR